MVPCGYRRRYNIKGEQHFANTDIDTVLKGNHGKDGSQTENIENDKIFISVNFIWMFCQCLGTGNNFVLWI